MTKVSNKSPWCQNGREQNNVLLWKIKWFIESKTGDTNVFKIACNVFFYIQEQTKSNVARLFCSGHVMK